MIKVLFVCHGNICRSTMAEFYFKYLIGEAGMAEDFFVDSAATSREEIGSPVDLRTRKKLAEHGIPCGTHYARQVTKADYEKFDYILIMDEENLRGIKRIIRDDPENKIHFLLEYTGENRDVADPWYTGNFETSYEDISNGCRAFLKFIKLQNRKSNNESDEM